MVTARTIEEQIQKLHATKREFTESVIAGSDSSAVNTDELIALLNWWKLGMAPCIMASATSTPVGKPLHKMRAGLDFNLG
jgi:hypothetical protein